MQIFAFAGSHRSAKYRCAVTQQLPLFTLLQKKGFDEVRRASEYYWQVKRAFDQSHGGLANPERRGAGFAV